MAFMYNIKYYIFISKILFKKGKKYETFELRSTS